PFSGTTVGYANDISTSCLNGTGGDRIFKIDVPNGSELFIGQSVNAYDSKHRIAYGGSCPGATEINTGYVGNLPTQTTNGTVVGCLDDDDLTHYYFLNNTGSTQTVYWIQDGYLAGQGTFTLEWLLQTPPPPPANDLCANATILAVSASCSNTSGTTVGASQELPSNPTCDPTGTIKDVWYKFNSGNNSTLNFGVTLGTASPDLGIEFFSACGTVASGLSVVCDFRAQTPNPTVVSGFALNTDYYFRLYTNSSFDVPGTFNVCIYRNPAPICASLTAPANGATNQNLALNLQWAAPTYAERYDVYLSTNQTLVNNQDPSVRVSTDQISTTYAASGLNGLTTYYWRVVPKNGSGAPTGCTTWSFITAQPQFATSWISSNTGGNWWCQGETRTVTVTLKNNGSVNWTDGGGIDYNVGIKWNGDPDYLVRVDAQNLASGATGTYAFTVTAPTAGNNNLTFDVVREGCFWFGSNTTNCGLTAGPGNSAYSVTANVNNVTPTVDADPSVGNSITTCEGSPVNLNGSASINTTYLLTTSGGSWASEKWVNITTGLNGSGTVVWAQGNGTIGNGSGLLTNQSINLSAYLGQTLYLNAYDQYDDSWDGSTYILTWNGSTVINNGGASPNDNIDNDATSGWDLSSAELEKSEAFVVISAPTVSWSGPSFSASTLNPTIPSALSGSNNYNLSSTFRGCTASSLVSVIANNVPTVATPATPSAICAGASYNPTAPAVTANGSAITTQGWQLETAVGSGSYAALTVPYTVSFADNGKKVRYTVTNGCGTTNSATVTLNIGDLPTVTTANTASICSGAATNIALLASAPSSFAWTVGTITGGITGTSSGSGSTIAQTLTNPSNSTAGTVQYIITPTSTSGSCAGASYTITVTVNPSPTVTTANTASICSGAATN
ncbi:MAG: PKD-like domain-containing protein, partial [Dolichospermum sp.]